MENKNFLFMYRLAEYGWSDVGFSDHNDECFICATHVLNNPLVELLNFSILLLEGSKEEEILLFEEPGTYKIHAKVDLDMQHLIEIRIETHESIGNWVESEKTLDEYVFKFKQQEFNAQLYGCIITLLELMKIKSYSENRSSECPFSLIKEYIHAYKRKYS